MIGVMKYWIQECDVDGFRCDVAYMVPTDFWEQARAELVKIKPDIMLLAEASKPELLVNAFDIDYSWPLLSAVNSVMLDGAPAFTLQKCWEQSMHSFPKDALHMRITDDHDEPRAIARFGVRGAMAASALMFTLDGVPLLYNGMEVGDATESGDPALFDKLPIFWHPKGRQAMEQTYRGLIQLRKDYSPFRSSPVEWVRNSDSTNLLTFLRRDEKDQFLVAINFCNRPVQAKVDVDGAGDFHPLQVPGISNSTSGALPNVRLGSFGWQIYHRTMRSQSTASMTKPASP
jgi:glycosidase